MLIVHLFVSYAHVNLCHFFSSSWCRGFAAASACGSSWTFLFTFFNNGKSESRPFFYLTADILTKVFQKCSLTSPLPNI